MSKIALSSNASGTGVFTIASLGTNTNQTLTLPDATGTVLSNADLASQALAEAGSDNVTLMTPLRTAQAVLAQESMTPLGTLTTTSGTTQTLSGLVLTDYAGLFILVDNVSHDSVGNSRHLRLGGQQISCSSGTESPTFNGPIFVSLASGFASTTVANGNSTPSFRTQSVGVTNASTSLSFTLDGAGNFDLGKIYVWGIK